MITNAILISLLLLPVVPLLHVIQIWVTGNSTRAIRYMFLAFGAYTLLWAVGYLAYLPSRSLPAFVAGICSCGFWCLSYMEAFSMLCRGFSLTILADILERGPLTQNEIVDGYAGGKGAGWLLDKRLESMHLLKLVQRTDNTIALKHRGRIAGYGALAFKSLLKLGSGG